jgi:hypothetical protein
MLGGGAGAGQRLAASRPRRRPAYRFLTADPESATYRRDLKKIN